MRTAMTSRPPAPPSAAERWYRLGADLARVGRFQDALQPLEQALAYSVEETQVPYLNALRSYYGLAVAMARGDADRGRRICEEAVMSDRGDPQLIVNLAQVYLRGSRKDLAIEAVKTALALNPKHKPAAALRDQLGVRRPPVFAFLARTNPLNRMAGRLRFRIHAAQ